MNDFNREELRGVHVRLPDGTEDVYVDARQVQDEPRKHGRVLESLEHRWIAKDGELRVYVVAYFKPDEGDGIGDFYGSWVAAYAPNGWSRVRGLWAPGAPQAILGMGRWVPG